ncbi:transmembrane protein 131 isoform X2 [Macrosteles quadrilineatus]|uniref:transmembrane protein 131 isoform X2 n=1 Tax=Macrosteles quadrilineatus TaxID=74068 RepID=UPI0023E0CB90|nr:transmembrane protein 131 isoform X2 [Macrosteles quadrilineatus]
MKVKMSFSPVMCYFLLFILLDVAVKSQMSSNSNSNAFLQDNNDVKYIVDNIPISVHKEFSRNSGANVQNGDESTNYNLKAHLKFHPALLDFKERPLGVPHHEKVTITNLHENKTVHMSSISGNTVHFHSSFFEDKVIPPLGNTSFNVVFLGREEGEIESNLFIHTSEGSFKYQVRGSSVQSPYRLRPLSGVRLPLNASFSPVIQMHNPYATPLQLVEVYSSGGEFHLELPSGQLEGPKHLWEIPAFLTKPIIRVRFHARAQKNHTAYIRLKVNNSEEVLVVPLEVEVGPICGLYSPEDVIDFGIGGSNDPPTTIKLWLHNSWKKPIKIQNVISTPVSKALRIDFLPVKVPAESDEPTDVAQLTFDWGMALETGHTSGRIVVKSKQSNQKLVIPYTATVLDGGLSYDSQVTRFRTDSDNIPPRTFHLTNNFKLPVAVTEVSLSSEAAAYFQLSKFKPRILQPTETAPLFDISPHISPHLTLDTTIAVVTNVSTLAVPLLCYDGRLVKVISRRNDSELELGTVGSGTEKQVLFALVNENPVPVTLLSWETSLPSTTVDVVAVHSGNVTSFLSQLDHTLHNLTDKVVVSPGHYVVLRVLVQAAQVGESQAHVTVHTEYETIQIPTHMRVEHGSLKVTPDPIVFNDCFPGKVCSETLRVQSLFSVAMAVTGVSGADPRLSFTPASPPLLPPATTTDIGTLSFDTRVMSVEDNYLATTHNTTGSTRWADTLELPAHCPDYDLGLLVARYDHYHNLSSRLLNMTLRLDTTEVREHMFAVRVALSWPRLAKDLVYPLTQVDNTTHHTLYISNPGTQHALYVQLVMDHHYPSAAKLLDNLPERLRPEPVAGAQTGAGKFVIDTSQSQYRVTAGAHRDSWVFLLPPATNTSVKVGFTPAGPHLYSATLLLRNNLTVLETIQLRGAGAYTQFKFGNRKPGSTTPLLFELAEKHLKDCEREKQRKFPAPNLTVKRSFTARNTGALPISVRGFHISGLACEGYGFRVLNCEAFNLPPNSTRKVDIAFTPDFTLARVQRTLGVWTSEGDSAANYTLVATLPPFLLSTCSGVLARPAWEPLLYYCAVTFMMFLLVCVLAAAFLESDRALKSALMAMSRDNTVQPVLDLKSIGTGVGLGSSGGGSTSAPDKPDTSSTMWTKAPSSPPTTHDNEMKEKPVKAETDNVAAVFTSVKPVSTSSKKREKTVVSKRFSDPVDSAWANVFSKPVSSSLPKSQAKPVPTATETPKPPSSTESKRKVTKKNSNPGRNVAARETVSLAANVGEDTETSSTTTESSHDDGDKEVEVTMALRECDNAATTTGHKAGRTRAAKVTSDTTKKSSAPDRNNGGSASSLEAEWEDEDLTSNGKKAHASTRNRKASNKSKTQTADTTQITQNLSGRSKPSSNKQPSSRNKEKQTVTQKRSIEKLPSLPKPVVYEPPPPPLAVWDESRASFSDVVARSDANKHQTEAPANPTHTAPAPANPSHLGPIGSKKTFPSVWGWNVSAPAPTPDPTSCSSFFMDTFDTRPQPQQTVQPRNCKFGAAETWTEPPLLLKMLQAQEQRRLEAEEFQRRPVFQDTWTPWEPICTGSSAPDTTPAPPHTTGLWGSDVWAPPPPPDTWAPPGLAPRPPPRLPCDDPTNPDLDLGLEYDPFRSLSNIWAPNTPNNFWKPSTTRNN